MNDQTELIYRIITVFLLAEMTKKNTNSLIVNHSVYSLHSTLLNVRTFGISGLLWFSHYPFLHEK